MKASLPFLRGIAALFSLAASAVAQTYNVTDLGPLAGAPTYATAINDNGQIAGYSRPDAHSARAWIWIAGTGMVDAGSLGGADNRATAVGADGSLYGTSQNIAGVPRGFVLSSGVLSDLGSVAPGDPVAVSGVNAAGTLVGTTTTGGSTVGFSLAGASFTLLGTLPGADAPATSAAHAINEAGRVAGVGSWVNGGTRAFRTDAGGNLIPLGTLGGNDSTATALNAGGEVVGFSTLATNVTHAFIYFDGVGMKDLGYLDYYHASQALGINRAGDVVGTALDANGLPHAVAWLKGGAIKDLAALVPPTSGWMLEAANSIDDGGDIVGYGQVGGQEHAFLLQRYNGPDTQPPIAVATATQPPYSGAPALTVSVKYWDNEKVITATTQGAGTIYVLGPHGYSAPGTITSWTTLDSQTVNTTYSIPGPGGAWGPAANGTYQVRVAAGHVSDLAGNLMPDTMAGTFTIGYQTVPILTIAGLPSTTTTGTPVSLTLTATGSYPANAGDIFTFAIDWAGDGSDLQTVTGPTNTVVQHAYSLNGARTVRVRCTDPHGVPGAESTAAVNVTQQLAAATVVATQVPGISLGLGTLGTVNGSTMYFFQGAAVLSWSYLTAGAVPTQTDTLTGNTGPFAGAGLDSRGRVILFGGSNDDSGALAGARCYPAGSSVASMPGGLPPPSSLSFVNMDSAVTVNDNLGRLYVYSGASGVLYRYTAGATGSGSWENLPSPPFTPGGMSWDGGDRIIVFGATPAVYSISQNAWTQPLSAPRTFNHAALGADGLIYLVAPNQLWTFDPVLNTFAQIATTTYDESGTAIYGTDVSFAFKGTDGFLYCIGENGTTGSVSIEKFDTRPSATTAPYISSAPLTTIVQGTPAASPWTYTIAASGKPRPTFSLDIAPPGMTVDSTTGIVTWTPTPAQLGPQTVVVRAINSIGAVTQAISLNVRSAIYADTTPPSPPTNVVVSNITSTTADISWTPGTDNVGVIGCNLYNHWVIHNPKGSGGTSGYTLIGTAAGTMLHLSGLKPYTSYPYFIASVDAAGNISSYVSAGFMTTYMSAPGITNGNNGPSAGPGAVVGQPFTSYTFAGSGLPAPTLAVVAAPGGAVWNSPAGTSGTFTWTPVAGQEGLATFTLSATNSSGTATQSYTTPVYPAGTDLVAPTTPGSFVIDQVGWNSCRATWTASSDNTAVTGYRLIATHLDSRLHLPPYHDQVVSNDVAPTVLQTTITGLFPSTAYDFTVQAFDAAGNLSAPASASRITLPQPFTPLPTAASMALNITPPASGGAAGATTMTWLGSGYYWAFTVESSPDLLTWTPVAPASQWPAFSTSFTFTPDPSLPAFFYHVKATPAASP